MRNTFKRRKKEAIEMQLQNFSLRRDNRFKSGNIYDTILVP